MFSDHHVDSREIALIENVDQSGVVVMFPWKVIPLEYYRSLEVANFIIDRQNSLKKKS